MILFPDIDPVAFRLGPLAVHWYGLMYMFGFGAAWLLGRTRASRPGSGWTAREVDDLVAWCMVGVILGGRLGYVLFYDLGAYLDNPLEIFKIWRGGMSFHGGLIGICACVALFARHSGKPFFAVADFLAPLTPLGFLAGRLGNFINGELWGRVTDLPWGMVFPGGGIQPRHPSQLYQAALEGAVLFAVVWLYSARPRPPMAVSGLYILCYGIFRFAVEFVRQPDSQLGFVAFGWMTMGQVLSLPMILGGLVLLALAGRRGRATA